MVDALDLESSEKFRESSSLSIRISQKETKREILGRCMAVKTFYVLRNELHPKRRNEEREEV